MKKIVDAVPMLLDFPARRFHVDYDKEADVLYISFEKASESYRYGDYRRRYPAEVQRK